MKARRVTPEDVRDVAAANARAFEDDPLMSWFLPKDETRLRKITVMFEALLRRSLKVDFYDAYTTDDRAGLALWARPGAWEPPPTLMLPTLPRMLLSVGLSGGRRMATAMGALKKAHPEEPHWYLAGLGTDPPKQRTGVGTALVRHVLDRCDAEHMPAYLETQKPENVPYYERFGYRVTGELDIPRGGPHLWLMWRDPQ